ncbi:MAG: hypothetical protein ABJA50_12100 [Chloroflexota bacterium]
MEKAITLQAHMHVGTEQAAASDLLKKLPAAFAKANPGLKLSIKKTSAADAKGNVTLRVYISGEQDPAADFSALTHTALQKAITALNAQAKAASSGTGGAAPVHLHGVKEMEGDDENSGVTLPPNTDATPAAAASTGQSTLVTTPLAARPTSTSATPTADPAAPPAPATAAPSADPPAQQAPTEHAPWWAFWRRGNS